MKIFQKLKRIQKIVKMSSIQGFVIHSGKPVADLLALLQSCGPVTYMGIIYKSFDHAGRRTGKTETNKTIVLCEERTIRELVARQPQYEKRVADYNWESFPLPNEEKGETWALHISGVPNDFTVSDAENFVIRALKCILPQQQRGEDGTMVNNFTVEFAPRSRETGEIFGFGRVHFGDHVDREIVKMCKLILHNTPLTFKAYSEQRRMVTCVWFRPPQPGEREQREQRRAARVTEQEGSQAPRGGARRPGKAHVPQRYRPDNADVHVDMSSIGTITKDGVARTGRH